MGVRKGELGMLPEAIIVEAKIYKNKDGKMSIKTPFKKIKRRKDNGR